MYSRKHLVVGDLSHESAGEFICCVNPDCDDYGNHYSATRGDYFLAPDDQPIRCGTCQAPMILARETHRLVRVK